MDDDVATWIEEETFPGAARQIPSTAPPASRAFGAAAVGARAPATPATPAGQRVFGVDANAPPKTAFATDAFLRRVPATARPATARPPIVGATSRTLAPTPTKIDDDEDDDDGDSEDERADAMDADGSRANARREEFAFADVVRAVETGETTPADAPAAFESACRAEASRLARRAANEPNAAKANALQAEADALVAEAATWSLVWYLLGEGADSERRNAEAERLARDASSDREREGGDPASRFDSGAKNPAPLPAPLSARVRMAARDETNDPTTFRLNRVVAWLEGMSRARYAAELGDEHAGDAAPGESTRRAAPAFDDFAPSECAWRETAQALEAKAVSDGRGRELSSALDPDGPSRTGGALHPTNADADARLLKAAWLFVRGGDVEGARRVCRDAGQPRRAASFGGGAGFGPAPVGAAADRQAEGSAVGKALEAARDALASAAAERAANRERAERRAREVAENDGFSGGFDGDAMDFSGDDHPSSVPLDTPLAIPAVRAALAEAASGDAAQAEDEERAAECEDGGGANRRALWKWACAETARQIVGGFPEDPVGGGSGLDVSSGGSTTNASSAARLESAVYGALAGDARATLLACDGDWEASAWALFRALLDHRVDAAVAGRTPGEPGDVLADADGADADTVEYSADDAFGTFDRPVDQPRWPTPEACARLPRTAEAILDALEPLARREASRGAFGGGGARGRRGPSQRDAQRCLVLGRTRELVQDVVLRWVESGPSEERGSKRAAAPPPAPLLRSGAHLLLFLQALLPDGGGLNPGGALHFHLNRVTALYVVHLIATRRYELVPRYARHLRPATLTETYARFFHLLADAPRARKAALLREALEWLPMEGEAGVRAIVAKTLDDSREVVNLSAVTSPNDAENPETTRERRAANGWSLLGLTRGPAHRERALEWACLAGAATHGEAAAHACALVRQLALQVTVREYSDEPTAGPGFVAGERRARALVASILPPDLQANAAASGRAGAAAELGDWAAYLAARDRCEAWRRLAFARDAAREADPGSAAAEAASRAARDAGIAARDAALELARPRARTRRATREPTRARGTGSTRRRSRTTRSARSRRTRRRAERREAGSGSAWNGRRPVTSARCAWSSSPSDAGHARTRRRGSKKKTRRRSRSGSSPRSRRAARATRRGCSRAWTSRATPRPRPGWSATARARRRLGGRSSSSSSPPRGRGGRAKRRKAFSRRTTRRARTGSGARWSSWPRTRSRGTWAGPSRRRRRRRRFRPWRRRRRTRRTRRRSARCAARRAGRRSWATRATRRRMSGRGRAASPSSSRRRPGGSARSSPRRSSGAC